MRIRDWSSDVCSSDLLIGGGVGALAGAAIGSEADRRTCEQWWSSRSQYYGGAYPGGTYPGGLYQNYGYGYGYGWYSPGVVVTTLINGPPIVTGHVEASTRAEARRGGKEGVRTSESRGATDQKKKKKRKR